MSILVKLRTFSIVLLLAVSLPANAVIVDFTDNSWQAKINEGDQHSATIGNVTITAGGVNHHGQRYDLTFNGGPSEQAGCSAGQGVSGLECDGDGIGIRNDEISQSGSSLNHHDQSITISFAEAVDVTNLFVLDLFGSEQTGEIAVINGQNFQAPVGNLGVAGGFYATGFSGMGITSILLAGNLDYFSDYALAAIEFELSPTSISTVPLPGALILFGTALLGMFGFRRYS